MEERRSKKVWLEIGNTKCETRATEKCLVVTRLRQLYLEGHKIQGLRFNDKGRDLGVGEQSTLGTQGIQRLSEFEATISTISQ